MQWFRRKLNVAISTALAGKPVEPTRRPTALLMPLEPRIMFDGAIATTVVEAATLNPAHSEAGSYVVAVDVDVGTVCGVDPLEDSSPTAMVAIDVSEPGGVCGIDPLEVAVAPPAAGGTDTAVVFVDPRVQDAGTLLENIASGTQVVYLDGTQDGLQQIADYLTGHPGASSVQLIAHGNDGDLWLGSTYLSNANIGDHAATLAAIGAGIQQGGDILIYGCETAAGEAGSSFVNSFAALTGRDVAASDDRTGASGDWDLEISVGSIEAAPALAFAASSGYAYDLAIITVTSNADSGAGTLRNAITSASDGDTITFNAGMSIGLTSGELLINKNLTIDGDLDNNGTADVTLDANYSSRVLSITSGTVSLDGLVIREGRVSGNGGGLNTLPAGGLGGGISITGGTVTISNSTITNNVASGGGGGGSGSGYSYGGGGGGGFLGLGGGNGGPLNGSSMAPRPGGAGSGGSGGIGGFAYYSDQAGKGGSTVGGAGGLAADGYFAGGAGGTAGTIGGGGGGAGGSAGGVGGVGGAAAGGLYIGSGATVFMSSTTLSNNLGAGGGGGGGSNTAAGGNGGAGVGGILNAGTLNYQSSTVTFTANTGTGGTRGTSGSTAAANGASVDDLTGGTINSNFSPNAAPVVANLNGDSVTFVEGTGAVRLDNGSNATVTDTDSANFSGGNVTVAIISNRVSGEDVLAVRNEGSTAGLIGVSGSNITFGGTIIGTVAGGTGTSDLVITLNASATPAAVQALVRNLTYSNSNSTEPSTADRAVRVTVNDGDGGTSNSSQITVSVTGVNDAPTLSATGATVTYTENGSAVDLFSSVSISTVESGQTIVQLGLWVTNLADPSNEILIIDGSEIVLTDANEGVTATNGLSYFISSSGGFAQLSFTTAAGLSISAAQTLVDGIAYRYDGDAPDGTMSRFVTLIDITDSGGIDDGGVDTGDLAIEAQIDITAVNDAPTLSGGPVVLTGTDENTTSSATLVQNGFGPSILGSVMAADVDPTSIAIAVTATVGNGTWQFSNDGTTWTDFGTVAENAALLLSSFAQVRYIPDGIDGETATLTFRAWDQSTGSPSTDGVPRTADATTNGGSTAFSAGTAQATLTVTPVNDAPTVSATGGAFSYTENASAVDLYSSVSISTVEAGQSITELVFLVQNLEDHGDEILVIDGTDIVLTAGNSGTTTNGVSFAVTGGGATAIVTLTSAMGLSTSDAQTLVDGVAYRNDSESASVATGRFVTLTSITDSGGNSNGGADTTTGALAVTSIINIAVNDAPTLSGGPYALTSVDEDTTTSGTLVSTILAGLTYADADTSASAGVANSGIAINATSGSGTWQYSTDGTTWTDVGTVSSAASLLLTSTTQVRYIPDGIDGGTARLTFRAWDQTSGTASSNGSPSTADARVNGGTTAFSTGTAQASLTVTAVNDAPTLTATGGTFTYTENGSALDLFSDVAISTIEAGQSITQLTLIVDDTVDGGNEVLRFDGTDIQLTPNNAGTTTGGNAVDYLVTIDGTGLFTVVLSKDAGLSVATAQTLVEDMSYRNDSNTPFPQDRVFTLTSIRESGDVTTALSIVTTVSVVAVNDAPGITAPGSISVVEDVATALTGISFSDIDAGSASVTVTLSTASGALCAASSDGVTAAGSGTGTLTLTGSIADINTFIAASKVSFLTALNGSSNVTLNVAIDDGGNTGTDPGDTGTGSSEAASTTVTLSVTAVNDAPVNTVPGAQQVDQDGSLVFSSANGNAISIADVDASSVQVTLTAGNGVITLSGITGLSFSTGSGTGDATMTFTGSVADINTALQGLTFTPTAAYAGAASLQVVVNDQGDTGTGGAQSDDDTIDIAVQAAVPTITGVASSTPDGTYKFGDILTLTVTFDDVVNVDNPEGSPSLQLATGTFGGTAIYIGGSGTNVLTFEYVVQQGDNTSDLDYVDTMSLQLGGATIRSNNGVDAVLDLPTVGGANSLAGQAGLVIDGVLPTASIVVADTALAAGETSLVTITFNEAVTDFDSTDLSVANGTLSAVSSLDGGITWTATLTPSAAISETSNVITLNNQGVQDAVGNFGSGTTDSNNYAIDTARPTATIAVADAALAVGESSLVTITFSEAVTGLTTTDLTVANGTLSALSSADGGVTWTATFTPDAAVTDTSNLITLDNTGVQDAAGNTGSGTTDSNNYAIDTVRPTASIVVADTALAVGESSLVTITFSEAITGLTTTDLSVANGTLSALSSADGGVTWTATFTPDVAVTDTSNLITLDNTGVQDAAGNAGSGTTDSNNYAIDTARPTASIVVADTALAAGESSLVTITFSEAVTGLTITDLSVANGTLSAVSSSDGGVTWTATFTPDAAVSDTSNLITLDNTGVQDAAGNTGSGTTDSNNYAIDTVRPTASIVVADTALAVGESSLVTITFSEAVTGLTTTDLSVANGTLSALSSADGGVTWTGTFTPDAAVTDTGNLITLDNTGVQDAAGNTGSGTTDSNNYAIDTVRPTASIVVADTALAVGESSLVTITFSEAVTGLSTVDLSVANGMLSALSSSDGGVTWTATFTPDAAVTDTSNLITLDNTGVQDAAGNAGSGSTDSNNYAIDTVRPTASIVVADTALAAGESSLVTITFSEAVTGLTTTDLSVANGTLSALSSADGGVTWTATFTPDAAVTDTGNLITLDNTGVQDAAGNTGSGSTDSNNYAIDTARPTASIVVADTALAAGESSLVTITFSEAVAGLTTADLTAANGTLSALSSADGGVTWTATFTPDAAVTDTSNLITLDNTGVQDAAGNSGSGSIDSNNYAIDTARPIVSIVVADTALAVGESSLVTITFSEAVTGLTTADLTVANGTLSALSSSDGGVTWTATFTPEAAVTDTSNLITLDNTGVQDAAGNAGSGTTDSNNYAIDTVRPTASIVVADTALSVGESSLVTITFSEAVTGLTTTDLSVANGTLSALSSADGGVTWTATVTPDVAVSDTSNLITLDNTGVQDAAGNAGSGTTDSNNYAIDTVRPTASIVVADTALAAGESSLVTITFSEAVTGLSMADLSVANGTLSALSSADGGVTWTATLTPDAAVTDTGNLITLDNTGVQDAAGNTGSGTTDSNDYAIDTARPTASIVVANAALAIGETSLVTITFSEAVSGFTNADLSVAGATLSAVSSLDGGITWTATLTPAAQLANTAHVITLNNTGVQDAAGNAGTGSTDSNSFMVDTIRPTGVIVLADTVLAAGETTLVTITFSEAVSNFSNADLTVANGTLSALSSNDGGLTWTATFTPSADVDAASNVITLHNTGVQDAAGNTGLGSTDSNAYRVDTERPSATISIADTALAAGESTLVTITFSEAVSNFSNADLLIAGGTLSAVSSSDGGVTWTATFTPSAGLTDASNLITLNNAGVTDGLGNAGAGSTDSASYAIDTALPTATLALLGAASADSGTVTYELTLSEAVSGIDAADFVLLGTGSVSAAIQSVEQIDAQTYRITVANVQGEGTLALSLVAANAGIVDAAGNPLTNNVSSAVRNVDTVPAVPETSEPAPLPPVTQLPSAPVTTPLIVLPVVTPPGIDVAAGNGAGGPSINSIVAASSLFITPLGEPVADAPRDAAVDRGVALVVPATGSYLGIATQQGGAPLRALPDLGVHSVSGERFSIALPFDTFSVAERSGTYVVVQARMTNGQPLPSWLKFDARTGTLSGRPPAGFSGSLDVEVSARDTKGNRAASVIHIDVQGSRPTAGRAGLDAQFKSARQDTQLDARLVRQLEAAARAPAATH